MNTKRNHIINVIITTNMETLKTYQLPSVSLLNDYKKSYSPSDSDINDTITKIKSTFDSFGVTLEGGSASVGSNVTQYEFTPSSGTKLSKIRGLEDDIALHLGVQGVRIIAPVKGKSVVAVEVPNAKANVVGLGSVLTSEVLKSADMELPITLGETATGEPFTFDLAKAPHVLIGGATGMGKSITLNVILSSLLFNIQSSILKFVMIDVKKVELSIYETITKQFKPDFLDEMVYTETTDVIQTLNKVVSEMDSRYNLLKSGKCRNIKEYNNRIIKNELNFNDGHDFLPYIVVVIDEFADLIMTVGKDIEFPITRLAQLSRAVGIHLVIATQRPTATVITGGIKANFPTRIAFRVASNIDSRSILDSGGAENLIGKGDLLYASGMDLERVQSAYIDLDEVERITGFINGDNV